MSNFEIQKPNGYFIYCFEEHFFMGHSGHFDNFFKMKPFDLQCYSFKHVQAQTITVYKKDVLLLESGNNFHNASLTIDIFNDDVGFWKEHFLSFKPEDYPEYFL